MTDQGKIRPITEDDMANIVAHLSYELEARGELPNANSLMMEIVRLRNELTPKKPDGKPFEWIWFGEDESGQAHTSFGRWQRHPCQFRYVLDETSTS